MKSLKHYLPPRLPQAPLTVRISASLKSRMMQKSKRQQVSVKDLIEALLKRYLDEDK